MDGAPDVVQPWMPRGARDKRGVPLARERRGWREAPRMCRSRCAGILQRALRGPLAATGQQAPGFWAQKSSNCWASEPAAGAWPLDAESLPEGACVPPPVVPVPVEAVPLLGVWSAAPVEAPAVALAVADAVAVALGVAVAVAAGFSAAPVPGTVI